jgi:hypothetical protein
MRERGALEYKNTINARVRVVWFREKPQVATQKQHANAEKAKNINDYTGWYNVYSRILNKGYKSSASAVARSACHVFSGSPGG